MASGELPVAPPAASPLTSAGATNAATELQQLRSGARAGSADPACCGAIDMCIHRDGHWSYLGSPILRPELVRLFASVLRKEGERYFLVTPVEKLQIQVEDAPFVITEAHWLAPGTANQLLQLTTNLGEQFCLDAAHPLRWHGEGAQRRPYVRVRDQLEAIIARPVYYDLCNEILDDPHFAQRQGLWSGGVFHEFN